MRTSTLAIASLVTLAATGLAGCSSGSEEPAAETAAESAAAPTTSASPMVGGMAACDAPTFTTAVEDLLASEGDGNQLYSLDGFECVDGWAVTFPTIGQSEDTSYTYTQLFQAEGQFWVPVDRGDVCGTTNLDDPTAYPADAQIPEAIWQPACNTN